MRVDSYLPTAVKKAAAVLTLLSFTLTQIQQPALALPVPAHVPPVLSVSSTNPFPIQIPLKLGRVETSWYPENGQDVNLKAMTQKWPDVILIQDAHGQISAQKNTRRLLAYLEKEMEIRALLLEGAAGEQNPQLLNFFQESWANKRAAQWLMQEGEIGGAELYLLSRAGVTRKAKQTKPVPAFGLEEPGLYLENLRQYQRVMKQRDTARRELSGHGMQIEKKASRIFNPNLYEFFKQVRAADVEQLDLAHALDMLQSFARQDLETDLKDPRAQQSWPMLTRYFALKERAPKVNQEAAKKEWQRLLNFAKEKRIHHTLLEKVSQDEQASHFDRRGLWESFYAEAAPLGFKFIDYPALSLAEGAKILEEELDFKLLQSEMDALRATIFATLAKTSEEKNILEEYVWFLSLEKLLDLKWTREDFRNHRVGVSSVKVKDEAQNGINALAHEALKFYQQAEGREAEFVRQVENGLRELAQKEPQQHGAVVLVAGGFHTEGITARLKEKKISYAVLTPHMAAIESEDSYFRAMTGAPVNPAGLYPFFKNKKTPDISVGTTLRMAGLMTAWHNKLPQRINVRRNALQDEILKAGSRSGVKLNARLMLPSHLRSEVRMDLNQASEEELMRLFAEMAPDRKKRNSLVQRIIKGRPYGSLEDLRRIQGIGDGRMRQIQQTLGSQIQIQPLSDFQKYLISEGVYAYPHLRELFDASGPDIERVKEALLEDRVLRPVFMVKLPDSAVEPFQVLKPELLEEMGGLELLREHSVFLAGSPATAEQMAAQGYLVRVGVTDRWSRDDLYRTYGWKGDMFAVAGGRQTYFPLEDGTWLGVKGAGQNIDPEKPPAYLDKGQVFHRYHRGLAVIGEAQNLEAAQPLLETPGTRFVQPLGYRRVTQVPDGRGGWVSTDTLRWSDGKPVEPVLIFNRVASPHRWIKLPQLLKADPRLEKLRRRITPALIELGHVKASDYPEGYSVPFADLLRMLAKQIGINFALAQNQGFYKATINAQDYTFGAEETDAEDFYTIEGLSKLIRKDAGFYKFSDILLNYGIPGDPLLSAQGVLDYIHLEIQGKFPPESIPGKQELKDSMFAAYFEILNEQNRDKWSALLSLSERDPFLKTLASGAGLSDEQFKAKLHAWGIPEQPHDMSFLIRQTKLKEISKRWNDGVSIVLMNLEALHGFFTMDDRWIAQELLSIDSYTPESLRAFQLYGVPIFRTLSSAALEYAAKELDILHRQILAETQAIEKSPSTFKTSEESLPEAVSETRVLDVRSEARATQDFLDILKVEFPNQRKLRVLDIGTGTGDFPLALKPLLEQAGFQSEIVAVDRETDNEIGQDLNQAGIRYGQANIDWASDNSILDEPFNIIFLNSPVISMNRRMLHIFDKKMQPGTMVIWRLSSRESLAHMRRDSLIRNLKENQHPFAILDYELDNLPAGSEIFSGTFPPIFVRKKGNQFLHSALQTSAAQNKQLRSEVRADTDVSVQRNGSLMVTANLRTGAEVSASQKKNKYHQIHAKKRDREVREKVDKDSPYLGPSAPSPLEPHVTRSEPFLKGDMIRPFLSDFAKNALSRDIKVTPYGAAALSDFESVEKTLLGRRRAFLTKEGRALFLRRYLAGRKTEQGIRESQDLIRAFAELSPEQRETLRDAILEIQAYLKPANVFYDYEIRHSYLGKLLKKGYKPEVLNFKTVKSKMGLSDRTVAFPWEILDPKMAESVLRKFGIELTPDDLKLIERVKRVGEVRLHAPEGKGPIPKKQKRIEASLKVISEILGQNVPFSTKNQEAHQMDLILRYLIARAGKQEMTFDFVPIDDQRDRILEASGVTYSSQFEYTVERDYGYSKKQTQEKTAIPYQQVDSTGLLYFDLNLNDILGWLDFYLTQAAALRPRISIDPKHKVVFHHPNRQGKHLSLPVLKADAKAIKVEHAARLSPQTRKRSNLERDFLRVNHRLQAARRKAGSKPEEEGEGTEEGEFSSPKRPAIRTEQGLKVAIQQYREQLQPIVSEAPAEKLAFKVEDAARVLNPANFNAQPAHTASPELPAALLASLTGKTQDTQSAKEFLQFVESLNKEGLSLVEDEWKRWAAQLSPLPFFIQNLNRLRGQMAKDYPDIPLTGKVAEEEASKKLTAFLFEGKRSEDWNEFLPALSASFLRKTLQAGVLQYGFESLPTAALNLIFLQFDYENLLFGEPAHKDEVSKFEVLSVLDAILNEWQSKLADREMSLTVKRGEMPERHFYDQTLVVKGYKPEDLNDADTVAKALNTFQLQKLAVAGSLVPALSYRSGFWNPVKLLGQEVQGNIEEGTSGFTSLLSQIDYVANQREKISLQPLVMMDLGMFSGRTDLQTAQDFTQASLAGFRSLGFEVLALGRMPSEGGEKSASAVPQNYLERAHRWGWPLLRLANDYQTLIYGKPFTDNPSDLETFVSALPKPRHFTSWKTLEWAGVKLAGVPLMDWNNGSGQFEQFATEVITQMQAHVPFSRAIFNPHRKYTRSNTHLIRELSKLSPEALAELTATLQNIHTEMKAGNFGEKVAEELSEPNPDEAKGRSVFSEYDVDDSLGAKYQILDLEKFFSELEYLKKILMGLNLQTSGAKRIQKQIERITKDRENTLHRVGGLYKQIMILADMALLADYLKQAGITSPELSYGSQSAPWQIAMSGLWHPAVGLARSHLNDIRLRSGEAVFLLGPNGGGKTVLLKAIISAAAHVYAAIPVHAGAIEVVNFNHAFEHILFLSPEPFLPGEKKMRDPFALFLKRTQYALQNAGPGTLVVIDELGVGADEKALAPFYAATIEKLIQSGAAIVVATHMSWLVDILKKRGINIRLMETKNTDGGTPSFSFHEVDTPTLGESHGRTIAEYRGWFFQPYLSNRSEMRAATKEDYFKREAIFQWQQTARDKDFKRETYYSGDFLTQYYQESINLARVLESEGVNIPDLGPIADFMFYLSATHIFHSLFSGSYAHVFSAMTQDRAPLLLAMFRIALERKRMRVNTSTYSNIHRLAVSRDVFENALRQIVESGQYDKKIRILVAGSSSGQEAFLWAAVVRKLKDENVKARGISFEIVGLEKQEALIKDANERLKQGIDVIDALGGEDGSFDRGQALSALAVIRDFNESIPDTAAIQFQHADITDGAAFRKQLKDTAILSMHHIFMHIHGEDREKLLNTLEKYFAAHPTALLVTNEYDEQGKPRTVSLKSAMIRLVKFQRSETPGTALKSPASLKSSPSRSEMRMSEAAGDMEQEVENTLDRKEGELLRAVKETIINIHEQLKSGNTHLLVSRESEKRERAFFELGWKLLYPNELLPLISSLPRELALRLYDSPETLGADGDSQLKQAILEKVKGANEGDGLIVLDEFLWTGGKYRAFSENLGRIGFSPFVYFFVGNPRHKKSPNLFVASTDEDLLFLFSMLSVTSKNDNPNWVEATYARMGDYLTENLRPIGVPPLFSKELSRSAVRSNPSSPDSFEQMKVKTEQNLRQFLGQDFFIDVQSNKGLAPNMLTFWSAFIKAAAVHKNQLKRIVLGPWESTPQMVSLLRLQPSQGSALTSDLEDGARGTYGILSSFIQLRGIYLPQQKSILLNTLHTSELPYTFYHEISEALLNREGHEIIDLSQKEYLVDYLAWKLLSEIDSVYADQYQKVKMSKYSITDVQRRFAEATGEKILTEMKQRQSRGIGFLPELAFEGDVIPPVAIQDRLPENRPVDYFKAGDHLILDVRALEPSGLIRAGATGVKGVVANVSPTEGVMTVYVATDKGETKTFGWSEEITSAAVWKWNEEEMPFTLMASLSPQESLKPRSEVRSQRPWKDVRAEENVMAFENAKTFGDQYQLSSASADWSEKLEPRRSVNEIIEHEIPAAMNILGRLTKLRQQMDENGASDKPVIIYQNLTLGEMYPFFTPSLKRHLGVVELSAAKIIEIMQSMDRIDNDIKKARFILVKFRLPSSHSRGYVRDPSGFWPDNPQEPWYILDFGQRLQTKVVMIDHSHKEISAAQKSLAGRYEAAGALLINAGPGGTISWMDDQPVFMDSDFSVEVVIGGERRRIFDVGRDLLIEATDRASQEFLKTNSTFRSEVRLQRVDLENRHEIVGALKKYLNQRYPKIATDLIIHRMDFNDQKNPTALTVYATVQFLNIDQALQSDGSRENRLKDYATTLILNEAGTIIEVPAPSRLRTDKTVKFHFVEGLVTLEVAVNGSRKIIQMSGEQLDAQLKNEFQIESIVTANHTISFQNPGNEMITLDMGNKRDWGLIEIAIQNRLRSEVRIGQSGVHPDVARIRALKALSQLKMQEIVGQSLEEVIDERIQEAFQGQTVPRGPALTLTEITRKMDVGEVLVAPDNIPRPVQTFFGEINFANLNFKNGEVPQVYQMSTGALHLARDLYLAHRLGLIQIHGFNGNISAATQTYTLLQKKQQWHSWKVKRTMAAWGDAMMLLEGMKTLMAMPVQERSVFKTNDGQIRFYYWVFGSRAGEKHLGNLFAVVSDFRDLIPELEWTGMGLNLPIAEKLRKDFKTLLKKDAGKLSRYQTNQGQLLFYQDVLGDSYVGKNPSEMYRTIADLYLQSPKELQDFLQWGEVRSEVRSNSAVPPLLEMLQNNNLRRDIKKDLFNAMFVAEDNEPLLRLVNQALSSKLDYLIFLGNFFRLYAMTANEYQQTTGVPMNEMWRQRLMRLAQKMAPKIGGNPGKSPEILFLDFLFNRLEKADRDIVPYVSSAYNGIYDHIDLLDMKQTQDDPTRNGNRDYSSEQAKAFVRRLLSENMDEQDLLVQSVREIAQVTDLKINQFEKGVMTLRFQRGSIQDVYLVLVPLQNGVLVPFTLLVSRFPEMAAVVRAEYGNLAEFRGDNHAAQVMGLRTYEPSAGWSGAGYTSHFINGYSEIVYNGIGEFTVNGEAPGSFSKNTEIHVYAGEILPLGLEKVVAGFARLATYFYDPQKQRRIRQFMSTSGDSNFRDDQFQLIQLGRFRVKSGEARLDTKLIALREWEENVDILNFIQKLFSLDYLNPYRENIIDQGEHAARLIQGVLDGFVQGLEDKLGEVAGRETAAQWLEEYLDSLRRHTPGLSPDPLFTVEKIAAFLQMLQPDATYRPARSEMRKQPNEALIQVAVQMTAGIVRVRDAAEIYQLLYGEKKMSKRISLSDEEKQNLLWIYTRLFKEGRAAMLPSSILLGMPREGAVEYLNLLIQAYRQSGAKLDRPLVHLAGDVEGKTSELLKQVADHEAAGRLFKVWIAGEEIVVDQLAWRDSHVAAALTRFHETRAISLLVNTEEIRGLAEPAKVQFASRLTQLLLAAAALSQREFEQLARDLGMQVQQGKAIQVNTASLLSGVFMDRMREHLTAVSA